MSEVLIARVQDAPGVTSQPLDADLTSWAAITRVSGFDTFVASPTSAHLRSLLTDETGTGAAVFAGGNIGAATATSLDASGVVSGASIRVNNYPFSEVASGNAGDGTWGGGFNFNWNNSVPVYNATNGISGISYNAGFLDLFAGGSATAGTAAPLAARVYGDAAVFSGRISAATEIRLLDLSYLRTAQLYADGSYAGGWNTSWAGVMTYDQSGNNLVGVAVLPNDGFKWYVGGTASAGTSISESMQLDLTGKLTVVGEIAAGNLGIKAGGAGSLRGKVGGTIYSNVTPAGNAAGSTTDVFSHTLAANVLSANGAAVFFKIRFVSQSGTNRLKLSFAGTVIFDTGASFSSGNNHTLTGWITRKSAGNQECACLWQPDGMFSTTGTTTFGAATTGDETTGLTFKATVTGVNANDVQVLTWTDRYEPAA